jgi:hypothetical protein
LAAFIWHWRHRHRAEFRAVEIKIRKSKGLGMRKIALSCALVIGGAVIAQAASAEEYRGTMEQQMACTPDVWRLCSDRIPDVNRIVACLQQNTPNLSSGCRAVFQSNNSMPPSQAMPPQRGRAVPPPSRVAPAPLPGSTDDDDD